MKRKATTKINSPCLTQDSILHSHIEQSPCVQ
ncbi:hypothetical protein Nmel_005157 [Mimus melanotis]